MENLENKLVIPFGLGKVELDNVKADVLGNAFGCFIPMNDNAVADALENCVYSEGYLDCLLKASRVLFILSDVAVKTELERFLPYMLQKAKDAGKEISILFSTGIGGCLSLDEKKTMLGAELFEEFKDRIFDHDCDDMQNHAFYGITKSKTPVFINKMYLEHDLIVPIGSVKYNSNAGYSGGRMLIFPGVGARKSALRNHRLTINLAGSARHPLSKTGELNHNPVHRDMVDAVMISRAGRDFFAVNTILDEKGQLINMVCGDLFMSHHKACELLNSSFHIPLTTKYSSLIVSCGGFPKDINMLSSYESLVRASEVASEGGNIFLFAKCLDGLGSENFGEFFTGSSKNMLESLLNDYHPDKQAAYCVKELSERFSIYLYSSLSEEDTIKMGFKKINSIEEISSMLGEKTAFIPSAATYFMS